MDLHLENLRREYTSRSLDRKDMPANPHELASKWIEEAIAQQVNEPTAVIVGTATPDGRPSTRTVLLKELLDEQFLFYSNYDSRKGEQIKANPHVCLTFLWHELERQIHIEGTAVHVAPEISDAYFKTRPYKSRVGARISPQSHPIPNRTYIVAAFAKESLVYMGREVPRPDNWGGFAVKATRIEFWQGRESRLHDRFLYEQQPDGSWSLARLAP